MNVQKKKWKRENFPDFSVFEEPCAALCASSSSFSSPPLPPDDYQPPFPPFFFFCGAFFRVAPEAAGFCCRGGTTLLAPAAEDPAAEPGLGEVGGLVAVLLASLEAKEGTSMVAVEGLPISSSRGSISSVPSLTVTITTSVWGKYFHSLLQ